MTGGWVAALDVKYRIHLKGVAKCHQKGVWRADDPDKTAASRTLEGANQGGGICGNDRTFSECWCVLVILATFNKTLHTRARTRLGLACLPAGWEETQLGPKSTTSRPSWHIVEFGVFWGLRKLTTSLLQSQTIASPSERPSQETRPWALPFSSAVRSVGAVRQIWVHWVSKDLPDYLSDWIELIWW